MGAGLASALWLQLPHHPFTLCSCPPAAVTVNVQPAPVGPGTHSLAGSWGPALGGQAGAGWRSVCPRVRQPTPAPVSPPALPEDWPSLAVVPEHDVTPDRVTVAAWPGCGLPQARLKMALAAGHRAASEAGSGVAKGVACASGARPSSSSWLDPVPTELLPICLSLSAAHRGGLGPPSTAPGRPGRLRPHPGWR